jgi:EamA domain-containing membrane protein RarD
MTRNLRIAVFFAAIGTLLTLWCLAKTTALSMTLFFSFGIPAYGVAAILYVVEVLRDLRRHRVL